MGFSELGFVLKFLSILETSVKIIIPKRSKIALIFFCLELKIPLV